MKDDILNNSSADIFQGTSCAYFQLSDCKFSFQKNIGKMRYFGYSWLHTLGLKDTVVNLTFHSINGGSLKITCSLVVVFIIVI